MTEARLSGRRLFLASAVLLIGRIGMGLSVIYAGGRIIASQPLPNRLLFIGGASVALTFIASRLSNTPSLIWQIALQSCAIAGLALGISILFRTISAGVESLLSRTGAVGLFVLLIGVASAFAMKRLQAKIKD